MSAITLAGEQALQCCGATLVAGRVVRPRICRYRGGNGNEPVVQATGSPVSINRGRARVRGCPVHAVTRRQLPVAVVAESPRRRELHFAHCGRTRRLLRTYAHSGQGGAVGSAVHQCARTKY